MRRLPLSIEAARAAMRWLILITLIACIAPQVHAQSSPPTNRSAAMNETARGEFVVQLAPLPFEGQADGSKLGRMSIDKTITGDLVATTRGQMLSAMSDVKGSAGYVAIEKVEGTLKGRTGSFVLQHTGTMARGSPSLSVTVVPDSGTGELVGLSGTFNIIIAGGKHSYEFTYSLP
jgi:Protein of unknown function (DUF3224)